MNKQSDLQDIIHSGIMAILRATSADLLIQAAQALYAGGVNTIEVTMTTPGALVVIEDARKQLPADVIFGAGSVLDPESARAAILAGARFIVSPSLNLQVISLCRRYSVLAIPGVFTPTEIVNAWEAGADLVKLFPANLGGPALIKALKAPLPQVEMIAVGGVEIENTADYIRAGAVAVGVGSALVNDQLLARKDFPEITSRAQQFVQQVKIGRGQSR